MPEDIVWFSDVDRSDIRLVGGKGANLGELYKIHVPVPNGFIVTSNAYFENLKRSGASERLKGILFGLDVENLNLLESKAGACQEEIKKINLDPQLSQKIESYYKKLTKSKNKPVAVRSSATAEDLPDASFAGQQATFLNIQGSNNLKEAILKVWASLFEARAIYYRTEKKFDHFKVGIAIPVQEMIESQVSGVMFTVDPVTNNKNSIIIEAIYGLGELIVSGQVTPDHYEVDKTDLKIKVKNIVSQKQMLVKNHNGNKIIKVAKSYQRLQKLPDEKIIELTKIGHTIEHHYFFPQDIEWAYQDNSLYIVQTRPVTTLKNQIKAPEKPQGKKPILAGSPASPGIGTGRVVIIKSTKDMVKVKKGDVLVALMTSPDYVPVMKKAVAIITERGGRTSHAAIVSREMGTPCVVGCQKATTKLKDGTLVTVDGAKGLVYLGSLFGESKKIKSGAKITAPSPHKTATKLYVNLGEPELAHQIAAKYVDGIGLLRAEFMLAQIGTHPKEFIRNGRSNEFVNKLSNGLTTFARAFNGKPVIYRSSDLKSNEYRNLVGGDKYEPVEPNPMLGYRGAFRYIKDPDVFKLELAAIKKVREKYKNVHLMIPYVRTASELKNVKEQVDSSGLFADPQFKFWMMAEIPANAIVLEEFIKMGIDGISIGSNDLTMLVLGTDRDNSEVASEFNELDPAVLWFLEKIVKTCTKYHITCSICGQAPSVYPQLTEKLVSWGITSISVNPDAIETTRQIIYEAEKKLLSVRK